MLYLTLLPANKDRTTPDSALLDECLARIARQDTAALAQLYHLTSAAVYGFALSILKHAQDAEDVLHDCYVSVYASAPGYISQQKPLAWILTITKNLCLQRLRERRKTADEPPQDWQHSWEASEAVTPEDRLVLAECLNQLTDAERQIVTLHAVAGFRHREIAALLELPLPTELSKYHRALQKLKRFLTKGEQP